MIAQSVCPGWRLRLVSQPSDISFPASRVVNEYCGLKYARLVYRDRAGADSVQHQNVDPRWKQLDHPKTRVLDQMTQGAEGILEILCHRRGSEPARYGCQKPYSRAAR
jgi:hypothetical protein